MATTLSPAAKKAHEMEKRFRALIKQADPHCPPVCKDEAVRSHLVSVLVQHVTRKRQYDDLFSSEESIDAFCRKHGLSEAASDLLGLMQEHKSIFRPNPILDHILTAMFAAEVVYVVWDMNGKGLLLLFVAVLFLTDAVISRVKDVAYKCGRVLSRWLYGRGFTETDPLSGPIQMKKWTEQSWQLAVHAGFGLLEYLILQGEPWWEQPVTCWIPHPYEQLQNFRTDLVILYMAQLATWMYTCVIHRFFDEQRKDYFVMYIHHIATIALVSWSFSAGYLRIGLLVLYVHDVSDVFIDTLKMANYLKLDGARGWFGSEIAYVASLIAWAYWRLYQYPFRVLRGSFLEPFILHAPQVRVFDGALGVVQYDLPLWLELNVLLFVLLVLHIYWFKLLLGVGWRIVTESTREASRQGYEGESDDDTKEEGEGQDAAPAAVADAAAAAAAGGATTPLPLTGGSEGAGAAPTRAAHPIDDGAHASGGKGSSAGGLPSPASASASSRGGARNRKHGGKP